MANGSLSESRWVKLLSTPQAKHALTELEVPVQRDVLMGFLDSAEHADPAVLDELSALITRRKRGKR